MINQFAKGYAWNVRCGIENQRDVAFTGFHAQKLAETLGGRADLSQMSPDVAVLYLLSLVLTQEAS